MLTNVTESCLYTEVDCVARHMAEGARRRGGAGRIRGWRFGAGPGLDRLPALAVRPAPGPGQRLRIHVAVRRALPLPPRAADRAADPGPVLPQLLRRLPGPRPPPPARLARLEQEEV